MEARNEAAFNSFLWQCVIMKSSSIRLGSLFSYQVLARLNISQ